jgi:hypothetical protein
MEEAHTHRPLEGMIEEVEALGYSGLVLRNGVLQAWRDIDLDACHRKAPTRTDYIFNFVFLSNGA